ncbi:MAG: serine/threonine protein kinase, partial [Bryobacteraceae bacterium]
VKNGGQWTAPTVWQTRDVSMYMNSGVLSGDLLFGFSHLKKGQLFCLDAATGAVKWLGSPRQGENAAMLASRSNLVILLNDGELIVAKPTAQSYQEIRRYTVAENQTWAHPIILADGVIVRDSKNLIRWSTR